MKSAADYLPSALGRLLALGSSRTPVNTSLRRLHLGGLDSIRFICALLVVLDHLHPALAGHGNRTGEIVTLLFWGQPAVIIFFVISGFCIHLPQAGGNQPLRTVPFLVRRLVRIGLPLVALGVAGRVAGLDVWEVDRGVLWSLYCEIFYYLAYPVLFYLSRRIGWGPLLLGALGFSFLEMIRLPRPETYYHHGFAGMIILGLPVWIMGCLLAEILVRTATPWPRIENLFSWRAGMFAGGTLLNVLHFHAGISFSWTLWLYALAGMAWLRVEMIHAVERGVWRALEAAGQASYSIYICHLPLSILCGRAGWGHDTALGSILCIFFSLLGSAVFFFLAERPSHRLAKYLGRLMGKPHSISVNDGAIGAGKGTIQL
jgi:peptidoglycan/LPS O-acetylase OafA/YrhL